MHYVVTLSWDEQDAVPFGTGYESQPMARKSHAWEYVKRVVKRAEETHVQLHNVFVWTVNRGSRKCVWCLNDPRKSGDPWPTWD